MGVNKEDIRKAYEAGEGTFKKLSEKFGVSEGTIKSWAKRDKDEGQPWEKVATNQKTKNKKVATNKDEVSWIDIENEYVTDIRKKPCNLESLSKKYNISFHSVKDHSLKDNWTSKRIEFRKKLVEKSIEKSADLVSTDIVRYKAKHLNISDKVLNEISKALSNENELYTVVEKLKQGFGGGEFKEEIATEVLGVINDSKVINLVNALEKLQKMQRQTLGVLDAKDIKEDKEIVIDNKPFELPARVIAPLFLNAFLDIEDKCHREYVFEGGRGSTKSSFISLAIIWLIKNNPTIHALACRRVKDTLRDSVFAQFQWAISALGLEDEFKCTVSPLEIEYLPTHQKIYFRGADDPMKIKSIKPQFGYIGIVWFEELDQYAGPEQIRSVEQSAIRGGDDAYIFKSFNPPKTANNWANKYIKIPKENQYQLHTTYLDVPKKWLGNAFIEEAEHLKNVNPNAYEHEYLGIANGNGGNVFDNVEIKEITDTEINTFDRIYFGVDFGWYPDPWTFNKVYFNAAQRTLYIFDEARENKKSNKATYEILVKEKGIKPNDKVVCDSAENKSIEDYRSYGLFARGAIKGPGSVDYSMKWLQSLNKIIIDNTRCPHTATEFLDYEYERDKEGNVISGYPDINNHHIDAIRYATEEIWKRKGM